MKLIDAYLNIINAPARRRAAAHEKKIMMAAYHQREMGDLLSSAREHVGFHPGGVVPMPPQSDYTRMEATLKRLGRTHPAIQTGTAPAGPTSEQIISDILRYKKMLERGR